MMKSVLCLFGLIAIAITKEDSAFQACCAELGVERRCQPYCDFNKTDKEVAEAFQSGDCLFEKDASPLYQCLNDKKDNRECCEKEGVIGICLDLCDGTKAHNFNPAYLVCRNDGAKVRKCVKPYRG